MSIQAEVLFRTEATLGEGALWDAVTQRLLWVDIIQKRVGIFDPASRSNQMLQLDSMVGTVVPTTRGDLLVALQEGVARLDRRTGKVSALRCPKEHDPKQIRFNDGKCDPRGRLWAGTMAINHAPGAGALYCFGPDNTIQRRLTGITIANGIVWSQDGRKMYYIDSPTRRVDVFDFEPETGEITGRQRACEIPAAAGFPDGMTIDAEGKLWIALWGGWAVQCWDPNTGKMLASIAVPVAHVTSCAFGGADLASLFITTAREGRSAEELGAEPLAGSLFVARPGARGVVAFPYNG